MTTSQTEAQFMLQHAYLSTKEYFHWSLVHTLEQNPQLARFIETFNSRSLLTMYELDPPNSTHGWESIHEGIRHSVIFPICGTDADPLVLVSFTIDQVIDDHNVHGTIEDVFELDGSPAYFEIGKSYLIEGKPLLFLACGSDISPKPYEGILNENNDVPHKTDLMLADLRKWIFSDAARPQKLVTSLIDPMAPT